MSLLPTLLARFRSDDRGAFLVIFGVLAIVLVVAAGAVVDFTTVEQARTRGQDALDSAALGLQPTMYDNGVTAASLKSVAQDLLAERLTQPGLTTTVDDVVIDTNEGILRLEASIDVPMSFVSLIGIPTLTARLASEVKRGSVNLEVAVALDVTGSMAGQRIMDLRDATNELIDIVVQDQQEPTYSKMSLVPYSMAVNVGGLAEQIRGPITGGKGITGATWVHSQRTMSGISKANPAVVTTSSNHGFATGDTVYLSGIGGSTSFRNLNGNTYTITRVSNTRFRLNGVNSSSWGGSYTANSGTVRKCLTSSCEVVVTSNAHGFTNGSVVYVNGVGGMTQINNSLFVAAGSTANTFVLSGTDGTSYGNYTSGGTAFCTTSGCQYYFFQGAPWSPWYPSGQWNLFSVSTCVSERSFPNTFTDVAPNLAPFGRNYDTPTVLSQYYSSSGNPCLANQILPLSSNKASLNAAADALVAEGSTAGHIGLAWAWYMVSPHFGYLWPSASQPAAYDHHNLVKVVILMTDGEFNTVYCNDVIAQNSTTGSGAPVYHHNCNSPNGGPYQQANALCDAMKAAGVVVYTVGFDITNVQGAADLMSNCATSPGHAHFAATGTDLKQAFRDIGRSISSLRLSR